MLDFIFGFHRRRDESVSYLLNFYHLFLVLGIVGLTILLYKILPASNKKSVKITKISFIVIMFSLEISRIFWRFGLHLSYGRPANTFDWIWYFSFVVCAVQVWFTIGVLIATFFVDSNNKTLIVCKNSLFGAAAVGGILSFIAPVHLNQYRYFFHFLLIQTNLQHFFLILVPLYLIKSKELDIRFKNVWMGAYGLIGVASVVIFVSHLTGRNFSTVLGDEGLEGILAFPHFLILKFIVPFSITIVMYLIGEQIYKSKNKNTYLNDKKPLTDQERKYQIIWIIFASIALLLIIYGPMLLGADINAGFETGSLGGQERALNSILAVLILLPIISLSCMMYYFSSKLEESNK